MGNMLESDSSVNSSDVEVEVNTKGSKERTAGDGMESDINLLTGATNDADAVTSIKAVWIGSESDDKVQQLEKPSELIKLNLGRTVGEHNKKAINLNPEVDSSIARKIDENNVALLTPNQSSSVAMQSISPRQLPSRELLIPVKPPPKLDNNDTGASGKSYGFNSTDKPNVKQKNPKFVPYEPYSAATRPIVTTQTHTRKPSESSSIASQSSAVSLSEIPVEDRSKCNVSCNPTAPMANCTSPIHSPNSNNDSDTKQKNNGASHYHHHPSITLMKERIRMAEKEINDLQTENTRLKKLFVDSMAGVQFGARDGSVNSNVQSSNNKNSERVDNLNDELEVQKSKFLSSCVLVEHLTRDNHDLKDTIYKAVEIIKDLKNTASLTQGQYENINEWLRKTNAMPYSSVSLTDSNFSGEDYLDATNS